MDRGTIEVMPSQYHVRPQRRMRSVLAITVCAVTATIASADKIPLGDLAQQAVRQSKLDLPGSKPFHLRASIVETTNPSSDYKAEIEEYWVSPAKWKRTMQSPHFSQTLIVNGDSVSEVDTGDYLPVWLNYLVSVMTDPLPNLNLIKQTTMMVERPRGGANANSCADLQARVDRWVVCFEGEHGLITSAFTKSNSAEFKDYRKFGDKRVARKIVTNPEPGTTIEMHIDELKELDQPDDAIFVVQHPTPSNERIGIVRIDEDTFRKLVIGSTDINWPPTGGGLATGGCAVFASADRQGQVREAWPAGCDNTGLQNPLRESVKTWRLKPAISSGAPVQVEALLGFTFHTDVSAGDQVPDLSDGDARKLATGIVEPVFPPGSGDKGSEIVVRISVDESGKLTGVGNPRNLKGPAFMTAYRALTQWHFAPYVKDGKPQYFHANLVFHVK